MFARFLNGGKRSAIVTTKTMDNRTSSSFQAIKTISNSVKYPTICPQTSNLRPNSSSPFHANNQTNNSSTSHGVVIIANDVRSNSTNQTNPEIDHQNQSAVLWLDDDEPGFLTVATLIVGQSTPSFLFTNMTSPPQQQPNNEFDSDLPVDDEIPPSYEQVVNESAL